MIIDPISRILIIVNNLGEAKSTVSFTGKVAIFMSSSVTLMTVVKSASERQKAETELHQARELLPEIDVATKVCVSSNVADEILVEFERGIYDLLAVGTIGDSQFTSLVFGSVAQAVVKRAHRPVLVIRCDRPGLRRILICTGGQEVAEPVVNIGARLAQAAGAEVTLLHIACPVPSMYTGLDEIEETLTELLQTNTPLARHLRQCAKILDQHNIPAELKLRHGVVVDEILREACVGDYDLVVIGAHDAGVLWKELMMDNVTRQVVDCAPCPVLVV